MSSPIDLELNIRPLDDTSYALELRYDDPESSVELIAQGRVAVAALDPEKYRPHLAEPEKYGLQLGEAIWADDTIKSAFARAHALALAKGVALRFRLFISSDLTRPHSLRWETLQHPEVGVLSADESVLFSRYLPAQQYRPIQSRPHTDLRALVFVANPGNLAKDYGVAPIDVELELEHARSGLQNLPVTPLIEPGTGNINHFIEELRTGYDIVYIVAHGVFRQDQQGNPAAVLLLEAKEDAAEVELVFASELVERINGLLERPSLVILASCQSAGTGEESSDALAALGPSLAQAGIPAVIAMHGKVQMETIKLMMPTFFAQLEETGQIDLALTVARARVRHDQPDWWMPVLYMTLRNGRIGWYTPGFGQGEDGFRKWRGLRSSIRKGKCTPIIGMGPMESWFGSRQIMAQNWSRQFGYPLSSEHQDDLPQVAQYVATTQSSIDLPRDDFIDYVYKQTWERYGHFLENEVDRIEVPDPVDLNDLMISVWRTKNADAANDPYTTIAGLKQKVYLLAEPSDLLIEALRAQDCEPQVLIAPWNDDARDLNEEYSEEAPADYKPSPEQPLVYFLFGRLAEPSTLVITEDDFFDYLIQITEHREQIPHYVRGVPAKHSLVFLGFSFQDWEFRTFFRFLMNLEGNLSRETHIAAQLEPTQRSIIQPDRAKAYLKQYLQQEKIDIFWGRTIDFLKAYGESERSRS